MARPNLEGLHLSPPYKAHNGLDIRAVQNRSRTTLFLVWDRERDIENLRAILDHWNNTNKCLTPAQT